MGGSPLRTAQRGGFTLLEIVMAMSIFFLVVSFSLVITADASDQALAAENARRLRMLAEMKAGEMAVFERYYDDEDGTDKSFENLPEELRELYRDWTWTLAIEDVTAFGKQKDENARYLFGEPDGESSTKDGTYPGAEPTQKGDTQLLRQLVLTVKSPENEGEGDSIEIVTFMPLLPQKTAAPAGGAK